MFARLHIRICFMTPVIQLAQSFIDIMAFFLPTFAVMLAISWVVSLFRRS